MSVDGIDFRERRMEMKKPIALLFALTLLLGLAACGGSSGSEGAAPAEEPAQDTAAEEAAPADEPPAEEPEETAEPEPEPEPEPELPGYDVTQEENVLFDEDGISITFGAIYYDESYGWRIPVTVVNSTDIAINVDINDIYVNSYYRGNSTIAPIEAGETKETDLYVMNAFLRNNEIEEIAEFTGYWTISDREANQVIYEIGDVLLRGPAYGYEQPDLKTDYALYESESDGIGVWLQTTAWVGETSCTLCEYIENPTGEFFATHIYNMYVNDVLYEDYDLTAGIRRGARGVDNIMNDLYYSWMGLESIQDLDHVTFDWQCYHDRNTPLITLHIDINIDPATGAVTVNSIDRITETEEAPAE